MKLLSEFSDDNTLLNCKTEEELIEQCKGVQGVINQYAPFTRRVLGQLKDLKVIVRYGVGVDNIDLEAASEFGIQICNVPDYGTNEVADHAISLMMALTRKVVAMNAQVKNGVWDYQKSIPIYRLQEQTVGIIGLGRIGSAFAKKAHGLGMKVIGCELPSQEKKVPEFLKLVSFQELLEKSDVISIHTPLNEQTRNLFAEEEFQNMKSNAYIINTARGGIINEHALDRALTEKWIAGAALDVLEKEPAEKNFPLLKHENFICTPHMGWYSEQAYKELKRKAAEEVINVLSGKEPRYPVNKIMSQMNY
ncbi:hypothetical protein AM500_04960 [Bacillus sp. FJAT-18017]|nr:hypothetical protein AM500_04960 [Bacillus sp. FJAT-18017]